MLTEQEAVERAHHVIRQRGIVITALASVRKIDASQLPPRLTTRGDIWAVKFSRPRVPGECVAGGDDVLVTVVDSTGDAELVLAK